jgi:hypothetical protein
MSESVYYKARAAALREGAAAIVAENDRMLWATKPGKHWAADLLTRMAETSDAVAEQGALPMPAGPVLRSELDQARDDVAGACLARWEEEQENARLRLALASAQRGRRELRARVAEVERVIADAPASYALMDRARAAASADGITQRIAPTQALREDDPNGLHHSYRVGRDLPEAGGAR